MLLLPDLRLFATAFKDERANLENNITVASHDEAQKLYKDVVNDGNLCTLITLIPSHDGTGTDEDNAKTNNNLTFLVLKKTDSKASQDTVLDNFALCQLEVLALAKKIKTLMANFGADCVFKTLNLSSLQILPLQNYMGANGYSISFTTLSNY